MPITLDNSNIRVTYNTGSSYVIETVKSDVFVRDTVGTTSNLYGEPTIVPSITPVTTGNHKTLNFITNLNFYYRTDESPYSWQEAYDEAVANGRRIPTITELRDHITKSPSFFTIWNGLDKWTPVINPTAANSKDWAQIGSGSHVRGKSHVQDLNAYPSWGDNSTDAIANIYLEVEYTNITYTLTFPFRTVTDVNNNSNLILQGDYNVNVSHPTSSLLPAITNTSNRLIPLPNTTTSNVSVRYHLLNPIKTTEGAQWTYSSNNPNVYHLGSVGIGTTSPEYTLDVRGSIYSSIGGYTQSGLTTWSITSDRRIKENIVKASYEKCLENVNKIELYNFNFKDNCVNTNDKHQLGFIAQEVREVYPKAVEVNKMILNTNETIDDILTLNTTQIDYTLYGAVKNLIEKIDNIDIELENLGSNITYNKDLIRNTSNIFSIITSNISITTSNIFTGTSNISITTSNISIITSNIFISTSNIPTETSNIPTETSNIPIYTSYIPFDTSNISIN